MLFIADMFSIEYPEDILSDVSVMMSPYVSVYLLKWVCLPAPEMSLR